MVIGNWNILNKKFHQISRDYSTQKISVVALAFLSSLRFFSVGDNAKYIQSIATFQINSRPANLFLVIVYFVRLIHEEDGEQLIFRFISGFFCSLKIELKLYTWYPLFSLWFKKSFFHLLSFDVFLTIAICIYLCFAEKVLFQFLTFGFINHTTRIFKKSRFIFKRLVVKKYI